MTEVPAPGWKKLGATPNATFYEVRADILAVVPAPDSKDDETTARASLAGQKAYWNGVGRRGAVIVYMDPVLEQDSGARRVYAEETEGVPTTCFALVGESFFAQMSAAVFEGLAKPGIVTRVFTSFEGAIAWIDEVHASLGIEP